MARPCVLPSADRTASAPGSNFLRGSMAGLHVPLSTLRRAPRGTLRMTRGQHGSLHLCCEGLAPFAPCRSPGAPDRKLSHWLKFGSAPTDAGPAQPGQGLWSWRHRGRTGRRPWRRKPWRTKPGCGLAQRRHRPGVVAVVVLAMAIGAVTVVCAGSGAEVVWCVHAASGAAATPGGQPWCVTFCWRPPPPPLPPSPRARHRWRQRRDRSAWASRPRRDRWYRRALSRRAASRARRQHCRPQ
jgi:hypothetical protein